MGELGGEVGVGLGAGCYKILLWCECIGAITVQMFY